MNKFTRIQDATIIWTHTPTHGHTSTHTRLYKCTRACVCVCVFASSLIEYWKSLLKYVTRRNRGMRRPKKLKGDLVTVSIKILMQIGWKKKDEWRKNHNDQLWKIKSWYISGKGPGHPHYCKFTANTAMGYCDYLRFSRILSYFEQFWGTF